MKIKSLIIKGLFGTFDYNIDIPTDNKPFILTGLNGYGKTTILNMVHSLSDCDLFYFFLLPFKTILFLFEDGETLKIEKFSEQLEGDPKDEDMLEEPKDDVRFILIKNKKKTGSLELREADIPERINIAAMMTGQHVDIGIRGIRTKEFHESLKRNKNLYDSLLRGNGAGGRELLITLKSMSAHYVEAQRMMQSVAVSDKSRPSLRYTVMAVSEEIKKQLENANMEYMKKAQEIDNNMLPLLLQDIEPINKDEYDRRRECLENKIKELRKCGMMTPAGMRQYDSSNAKVLSAFLINMEKKLDSYKVVLGKINLFSSLLDKLNLVNKKITLSQQHGLIASAADETNICLDDLSSGEQNELIMLYSMIFWVPDHSIFLIDEPETSLHIEWQADFLDKLELIAKTKDLQTIVATHSPQIIGGRWRNCFDLTEAASQN